MPTFITKKEKEIIVNNTKLVDQLNSMNRFSNNKNLDMIIQNKDNNDDLGATIDYVSTRYSKDYKEVALLEKYDNLINELNKQKKLTKLFDNLSEIKKYLTKDKNANNYASLFRKKYLDKDEKLKNSVKFKNYIVKNKLINIFGITTTSTITLTLLKKNDTDLFYD
ncbi:hypothetical protein IKS57_03670 [bacterium]|nr:hypothetical protein [bacterium]